MFSILSTNGYGILKSSLEENKITKIKEDLTNTPYKGFSNDNNESFIIYKENSKRIYVPRYYGLQNYGIPNLDKLGDGVDCPRLIFNGVLREQQKEPIEKFIKAAKDPLKRGGIISVPCGFGKTIMGVYLSCYFKKKTMFVSHKDFLNQQFIETVKEFVPEAQIGIIKQKKVDIIGKDIIVASLQSLAMREYPPEIFNNIGLVIIDEVHHTGAQVFSKCFKNLNHPIILGLSATLNRKDGMRKVFEYYIGKSVYNYKSTESTEVIVKVHKYFETDPLGKYGVAKKLWNGNLNSAEMINNIASYSHRNNYIINILKEILEKDKDRKILILSERRNQLKIFEDAIKEQNIPASYGYYVGGMNQKDLDISSTKDIILATYQLASEGFNVPSLNTVIFASPISDIQQSIGRILRQKANERKYIPLCIDIWDQFASFYSKGNKRIAYYKKYGYDIEYYYNGVLLEEKEKIDDSVKSTKITFINDE